ncbi:hypothetical protein F2Q70_00040821 [Brassica cretica]|uniref:RNase H type-1 domain-containing protein n=1 Tax=Brassica cretica TaxID=69181 RepID=A0A8S9K247_BRACR|nr:hypothetical protein F2Q70_00040821 [Brassica cretica]
MRENTACCRCGAIETTDHLLFQCRFARDLWSLGPWETPFDSSSCDSLSANLLASLHWRNLPPIGISINIFPWICWIIWVERNRLLFEKRISTPEEALIKAIKAAREWEAAQLAPQKALKLNLRSTPEKELPPNTITCNTDAAWIASSIKAGFGWIFFDSSDMEIHRGSSNQLHVSSACMAEALAVREALLHASSLGFTKIWLRSVSQVLIREINQKRGPTELFGVLSDIISLSSSFQFCCFSFLPRDLNGLADSIAKPQLCA